MRIIILLISLWITALTAYAKPLLSLEQLRIKGSKAQQSKKYTEAKQSFLEYVQRYPNAIDEYFDLAKAALWSEDYETDFIACKFFLDRTKKDQPNHPQIATANQYFEEINPQLNKEKRDQYVKDASKNIDLINQLIAQNQLGGTNGALAIWQESYQKGHFAPRFDALIEDIKKKMKADHESLMDIWWKPQKSIAKDGLQLVEIWSRWNQLNIEVKDESAQTLSALISFYEQDYQKTLNQISSLTPNPKIKYLQLMTLIKLNQENDAFYLAEALRSEFPEEPKFELLYGFLKLKLGKENAGIALRKGLLYQAQPSK
jgi:hypothetical protein